MAQAMNAAWFSWEAMATASLHVFETAAMMAASQAAMARMLTDNLGWVVAMPVAASAAALDTARVAIPDVGRVEPPANLEPPL